MGLKFNPATGALDLVYDKASQIKYDNTSSGLAATQLQAAVDEVQFNIDSLPDPLIYKGTWDASTNTPTLSNSDTGKLGYLYQVNVAGSVDFGAGSISFEVGDKVVNNGSIWEKWDMTDAVSSVNGQVGAVSLDTDDINEGSSNLYFTTERAQDAAGALATSSSKVSLTYDDLANTLTADIVAASITNSDISPSAAVDYSKLNLTGSIVNADVNAAAAIAYSKLNLSNSIVNADIAAAAAIAYAKLNLSNSIVNADIAAAAAISYSKLNLTGSIVNADISASAAIARTKIAAGTSNHVIINDGSGNLSSEAILAISRGGTNSSTTLNNNRVMKSSGGSIIEAAAITANRALSSDTNGIPVASTTTDTELGFVSGVTSSIQTQLDEKIAKSLVTTKGDLVGATGNATPARVAVGTDGTFLKADSSTSTGLAYTSTISTSAFRSVTTTDSPTTSDDVLVLSGASFTVTLFTAVGNTGKMLTLLHNGTSLSQKYTLNTTSGQTIGGVASGSYILTTNQESLKIISNGSNWLILEHKTDTNWTSAGTITLGATTTAPTKGNTQTVDQFLWRRQGNFLLGKLEFRQTSSTGSAAGSGDYLYTVMPTGAVIDTTFITVYTTVEGVGSFLLPNSYGIGMFGNNTNEAQVVGCVYDTTRVRLAANGDADTGMIGSAFLPITAANMFFTLEYALPVSDWQP